MACWTKQRQLGLLLGRYVSDYVNNLMLVLYPLSGRNLSCAQINNQNIALPKFQAAVDLFYKLWVLD